MFLVNFRRLFNINLNRKKIGSISNIIKVVLFTVYNEVEKLQTKKYNNHEF